VLEITESTTLLDAVVTLNVMERLKELGVEIALDDFGTGYSSLSYLVRLHPKIIKIDRYFVSRRSLVPRTMPSWRRSCRSATSSE